MESNTEAGTRGNSPATEIEYAGFWIRVLASVLDSILLLMIVIPLLMVVYGPGILFAAESPGLLYDFINIALPLIVIIIFWQYRSATPGKIMMNIYIVDALTLKHPAFGKLLLRYIGYYVSIIPLMLGIIWVGIDKRKQGFHDKIAGTLVIKGKPGEINTPVAKDTETERNSMNVSEPDSTQTEKQDPWRE